MPKHQQYHEHPNQRPEERPFFDFYQYDGYTWVVAFFPAPSMPGAAMPAGREVCVVTAYGEPPDDDAPAVVERRGWRTPKEAESDACEIASALNAGLMLGRLVR